MLRTIMEIRARPTSLTAMPRRALGVISSRVRWKDHFSISFVSFADLGGKMIGVYIAFLLVLSGFSVWPVAVASSLTMTSMVANSTSLGRGPHRSDLKVTTAMKNAPGDASYFVGERNR
jgi:hypothetical protein